MKDELSIIAITLDDFDDSTKILYFQPALCSVMDYCNELGMRGKLFAADQLLYIFKTVFTFITTLSRHGCYHNDIKPENLSFTE